MQGLEKKYHILVGIQHPNVSGGVAHSPCTIRDLEMLILTSQQ
jgi:hypothetical protein